MYFLYYIKIFLLFNFLHCTDNQYSFGFKEYADLILLNSSGVIQAITEYGLANDPKLVNEKLLELYSQTRNTPSNADLEMVSSPAASGFFNSIFYYPTFVRTNWFEFPTNWRHPLHYVDYIPVKLQTYYSIDLTILKSPEAYFQSAIDSHYQSISEYIPRVVRVLYTINSEDQQKFYNCCYDFLTRLINYYENRPRFRKIWMTHSNVKKSKS